MTKYMDHFFLEMEIDDASKNLPIITIKADIVLMARLLEIMKEHRARFRRKHNKSQYDEMLFEIASTFIEQEKEVTKPWHMQRWG